MPTPPASPATLPQATRIRRVLRPDSEHSPAFELAYVRTGPRTHTPTMVIPGGPGLGSILPFRGLRRLAASGGLDLIMVEHRGVGFSRKSQHGMSLPQSAMWITEVVDDLAAVLDREGVQRAFVAGSSYGSYLASTFGARHPDRVAGMLLDSALQSTGDLAEERELIRARFWDADTRIALAVRTLADSGTISQHRLLDAVRAAYELGGDQLLWRMLSLRLAHRRSLAWRMLESYSTRDESIARVPGYFEFDRAGVIGFRELNYGANVDGKPLDPALTYAALSGRFPEFTGEPYDLTAAAASFHWPLALLVGSRDVRTPPAIAHRVAAIAPQASLVTIENGHSALDTHPVAFLNAVKLLVAGRSDALPGMAATLNRLPLRGIGAHLPRLFTALARFEAAVRK